MKVKEGPCLVHATSSLGRLNFSGGDFIHIWRDQFANPNLRSRLKNFSSCTEVAPLIFQAVGSHFIG